MPRCTRQLSERPHIAVVGGGITGLSAARELSRSRVGEAPPRVTLLEASDRLGGKIQSSEFADTTVDLGPESLLTALPAALDLCRDLGLADELVAPAQGRTTVWTRGALRELPPGILGSLPDGVLPILRSGILSPAGMLRAGADLVLPRTPGEQDQSVGALVRRRFGAQALERMIEPLLGGIYSGDPDQLSLGATAPRLERLAREHRSLIRGLMHAGRHAQAPSGPMFMTLPGGLRRVIEGLRRQLDTVELRLHEGVQRLTALADGRYQLVTTKGASLTVDGVVLAVPAYAAGEILAESVPEAARLLSHIEYASVAVLWLSFHAQALPPLPPGTGFLVPRSDHRTLSACTWASAKWPHLARPDRVLLRCSVGRGRPAALDLEEPALVKDVLTDLREAIGVREPPLETRITRWTRAMPQYSVGHLDRLDRLDQTLTRLPRIKLAGAAFRGMGVPQCITQGQEMAAQLAVAVRP